jgi:glutathione-regulated potassium-efflux system ancillary protein KefC
LLGVAAAHAAVEPSPWRSALIVVAVIAGVILGGRLLVRPALRWIARSHTPEIFTAASLLLVVAIAALMQKINMSMALGAFLAGVLLAESEYKHELETDIEPFKGLLLGLFFIAVGMSIDFGALLRAPGTVLAILTVFLAVKILTITALAKLMGVGLQDRPVFSLLLAQGGEFAFVVFQAAAGAAVFSAETASLLIGAVALSMLVTPLLLVAVDRWLLPRYADCNTKKMAPIAEQQDAPVVIAGFGRYGQIIARLLMANGMRVTILDHDADRIESARAFGYRVFYGDATRLELLRIAGAGTAKVLVVAVDSVEACNAIVDLAQKHFSGTQLVVRVRDLTHAHDMMDRGIEAFDRELFDSSLRSARRALDALGVAPEIAAQWVERFTTHNHELIRAMHPLRHDRNKLIATAKQSRADLEAQMQQDRLQAMGESRT